MFTVRALVVLMIVELEYTSVGSLEQPVLWLMRGVHRMFYVCVMVPGSGRQMSKYGMKNKQTV